MGPGAGARTPASSPRCLAGSSKREGVVIDPPKALRSREIGVHLDGTLDLIGAGHDLSRERVRQLLDAAHARLVSIASMRPRVLPRMAHDALRMLAGQ